jgi:hypothetical protein
VWFRDATDEQNHGAMHRTLNTFSRVKSAPAVVPQIDHCIGKGFECVVQLTETFKAQEQAPELVFPGEQPLDGTEPLFEDGRIEPGLASSLGSLSTA